jgi:GTPase SAR1 family protein
MSISGHGAGYFDVKYKIMVLGESKVDKTQLIKRYTKDQFGGVYLTTVGMDFQDKIIEIEGSIQC